MHLPHYILQTALERKLKSTLSLKRKKLLRSVANSKITLILHKGRFLLIPFCKHVLIARDKLLRYGRTINNYFFSIVIAKRVCKNVLFKKVLMRLSTSLMRNKLFLKRLFKWMTFVWNLERLEAIENILNRKIKVRPILCWSYMKLLQLISDLHIKISRKGSELLLSGS